MALKKKLTLFPDPEAKLYSCGFYPLGREDKPYQNRSQKLVSLLGIKNIKELLVIDGNNLPFIKTFEKNPILDPENDVRVKPYSYSFTPLNGLGPSFSKPQNKKGLLKGIEDYISRNMDHKALAVVHPNLTDFLIEMLKKDCCLKIHEKIFL